MSKCGLSSTLLCLSNIEGDLEVTVTSNNVKIDIDVLGGGFYKYHLILSESNTVLKESKKSPTSGSTTEWIGYTDILGHAEIHFQNTAPSLSWYPVVTLLKANVGDIITVGS